MQKPRTIDNHLTCYPWQCVSPEPHITIEDTFEQIGNTVLEPNPSTPRSLGHIQSLPTSPTQPTSPATVAKLEEALSYMQASSPPSDTQPITPDCQRQSWVQDEIDQLLNAADEVHHDYPYDCLLDEQTYNTRNHLVNLGDDLEKDEEQVGEFDPENVLYDKNFGLAEGDIQDPEVAYMQFRFTLDEEPTPGPEDEPDDEDGPKAQCTAFEEPEIIRNTYIDRFIQKSLYGATHRVLKHPLKAAHRTIATHPHIQAGDIANVAQAIGTAEK